MIVTLYFWLATSIGFTAWGKSDRGESSFHKFDLDLLQTDPSNWGGGWIKMALSTSTSILVHSFAAFFDDRSDLNAVQSSTSKLYIRVLLAGQRLNVKDPSSLPDDGAKELKCRLHYVRDVSGMKETDYFEVPVSKFILPRTRSDWYPSSFAQPYSAVCFLPSLTKPNTSVLPVAVTILPVNKSSSHHEAGHTVIIGGKENMKIKHRILDHRRRLSEATTATSPSPATGTATSTAVSSTTGTVPKTVVEVLRADLSSRIHDGFHSLQMQHSHHHHHRREEAGFAVCVNPLTGPDALSNDYNDPTRLMSFINYYSSLGASHIFMYNTMETYTAGQFVHQILHIARKTGVSIELLPVEHHQAHLKHVLQMHRRPPMSSSSTTSTSSSISASTSAAAAADNEPEEEDIQHSAYVFPTLFPALCLHNAAHRFRHVLLVDYSDILVPKKYDNFTDMLTALDKTHPEAASFEISGAAFLGPAPLEECDFSSRNSTSAVILCKTTRTAPPFVHKENRHRSIFVPSRVAECDQNNCIPLSGYTTVTVPYDDVAINIYRRQSYLKTNKNAGAPIILPPSAGTSSGLLPQPSYYHTINDTSILKFTDKILTSRFHREIDAILRGKYGQTHSSTKTQTQQTDGVGGFSSLVGFRDRMVANALRKALSPEGSGMATPAATTNNKLATLAKFEIMTTLPGAKEESTTTKRLMIFSHLRHSYPTSSSDPMRFRRYELAVASWISALVLSAGTMNNNLIVRVVLMVSVPQDITLLADRFNTLIKQAAAVELKDNSSSSSSAGTSSSVSGGGAAAAAAVVQELSNKVLFLPIIPCTHPLLGIPTVDCMFRYAATASHLGESVMYVRPGVILGNDLGYAFLKLSSVPGISTRGFVVTGRSVDAVVGSKDLIGEIEKTSASSNAPEDRVRARARTVSFHTADSTAKFSGSTGSSSSSSVTTTAPIAPFLHNIVNKWMSGSEHQPNTIFRQDYILVSSALDARNVFNVSLYGTSSGSTAAAVFVDGTASITAIRLVTSTDAVSEASADVKVIPYLLPELGSDWLRIERGEASSARYAFKSRCTDGSLACEVVEVIAGSSKS